MKKMIKDRETLELSYNRKQPKYPHLQEIITYIQFCKRIEKIMATDSDFMITKFTVLTMN